MRVLSWCSPGLEKAAVLPPQNPHAGRMKIIPSAGLTGHVIFPRRHPFPQGLAIARHLFVPWLYQIVGKGKERAMRGRVTHTREKSRGLYPHWVVEGIKRAYTCRTSFKNRGTTEAFSLF
jgi:hypothetical protein